LGWRKVALLLGYLGLIVVLFGGGIRPALAQTSTVDKQAQVLFDNGRGLYNEGQYSDAIAAWERAYALSPRPLILFNIANAYERDGQIQKAIDVLNRYRAFAAAGEGDVILRRIRNLEDRVAKQVPVIEMPPPTVPTRKPVPVVELGLVSFGAVGLVTGALLGSSSRNQGTLAAVFCAGSQQPCQVAGAEYLQKERQLALGADVSFGVGLVALTTGVGLWVLRAKKRKSRVADVSILPSTQGVVLHGQF
jgi:tetratricopeptide (TPR) repeat protein